MNIIKYPIIGIGLCFGLGIIVQNYFPFSLTTLLTSLASLFILFTVVYLKESKQSSKTILFGVTTFLFTICLGSVSLFLQQDTHQKNHYSNSGVKEHNLIKGLVIEELKPNAYYSKFILKIDSFNHKKSNGKLLLYFSKQNKKQLEIGDAIFLNSELKPIPKNYNPDTFDYAKYMENQNIFHQIKCFEDDYFVGNKVKTFSFYINEMRQKLVHSFDVHDFSASTKSILNALLLGQKQQIDSETLNDYKNAGVVHILAISGLHIGIIYAFFTIILGFLNRFKHGKIVKLIVIIILLWIFALISGMSASITRAVTMFSLLALGTFLNRRNFMFNAVASSFLILLLYNPLYLFDVGFQLSYAAVTSIVLFQPFYSKFYFSKNKIVVYTTDLFLVSMAAQLGVLPFMMLYFKQFPMLFLLANFVVIPFATIILMTGIVTLFLNFTVQSLSIYVGKIISFLVEIMNRYIHWLSGFENYIIKNITFTPLLALVLYGLILGCIYWIYKPINKRFLYVLLFVFCFQLTYFFTKKEASTVEELIVFNTKETIISIFENNKITLFTNDSLIHDNQNINEYITAKFNPKVECNPLENVLYFKNKKIVIVDENTVYNTSIKPDVVVLRQNSRINMERLILTTNPKIIVADKSNSYTSLKRWKVTCLKYKIPFHAIAEKGFYKM